MAETHRPIRTDVVPEICVDGAATALDFYVDAFGAKELLRHEAPDGRIIHGEISFDGFVVFVVDDFPELNNGKGSSPTAIGGTPITLHRDVADVDAAVDRAVAAGATLVWGPEDIFWGDRYARLADPFGHQWSLATPGPDAAAKAVAMDGFPQGEDG
ncbi:MAG: VOC family protein [Acidimicrobiales bacterium]|nr:VOC family protein [Acidimicrobiales bacterium]